MVVPYPDIDASPLENWDCMHYLDPVVLTLLKSGKMIEYWSVLSLGNHGEVVEHRSVLTLGNPGEVEVYFPRKKNPNFVGLR